MSGEPEEAIDDVGEQLPTDHDIESLRTAQDEARVVLDHQMQTFSDVDTKAAGTFRLDAILLGLLVTAASFVARVQSVGVSPYVNRFTISAVIAIIVSFTCAVLAYTGTEIKAGFGPAGIRRLLGNRYTETELLILLLRSEARWMQQNKRRQSINARYLYWSHGSLLVAILLFFAGITIVHLPVDWETYI